MKLLLQSLKINSKIDIFDTLSSSHLQVPLLYKEIGNNNFRRSFSGLSCIGPNLQAIWTKFYSFEKKKFKNNSKKEQLSSERIIYLMKKLVKYLCEKPADISFLKNKGTIKKGKDADIVIWNPFKVTTIEKENVYLKHPEIYLYCDKKLYGSIEKTFLRGKLVYDKDNKQFEKIGKILSKNLI